MYKLLKKLLTTLSAFLLMTTPVARADEVKLITPSMHIVKVNGEVNRYIDNIYGADTDRLMSSLVAMSDRRVALNYIMSGLGDSIYKVARSIEREPIGDYITFSPKNVDKFGYCPAIDGVRVKWDRVLDDVAKIVRGESREVRIWYEMIPAEVRYPEGIDRYTTLRGSYTTTFNPASTSRVHNIRLAGSSISGVVVRDGERFSFNEVVGKRTIDRGYMVAPVIVKGELVDGVGGGVCQVSTTLYNAVTLAGLKSVKKCAHSMPVNYVSPSRDVTVSEHIDYAFVNDSGEDIYIECRTTDSSITVYIYGMHTDENIDIHSEYEDIDGYRYSTAYLVKKKHGFVISRTKLRIDKYLLPTPLSDDSQKPTDTGGLFYCVFWE